MTKRAFVLGLLGAALIAGITYINDEILRQTYVVGNNFPVSIFGTLVVFLFFNAWIAQLHQRLSLSGKELALILAMTLTACAVPGSSLMRIFSTNLMMPHRLNKVTPGWQKMRIVDEIVPEEMLVDATEQVHRGHLNDAGEKHVILGEGIAPEAFAQMKLKLVDGDGAGQVRTIAQVANGAVHLDSPWDKTPKAGDGYVILRNNEEEVLTPFVQGHPDIRDPGLGAAFEARKLVPWRAWRRTLLFWVPLILVFWLALIGLSFVIHQQWSEHEHLPYPIATFASHLLPGRNSAVPELIRDRRFLITAGIIACIYFYNYLCSWYPNILVSVPTSFSIRGLVFLFPVKGPIYQLWNVTLYFTVIAIAYFLPSDVSFSLGISKWAWCLVLGVLALYGVNLGEGGTAQINYERFLIAGAYLGTVLIILYAGRHFYWNTLTQAVGHKTGEPLPGFAVMGARLFLVMMLVFIIMLNRIGLDWPVALLYFATVIGMYLVLARIIAETGLFFLQTLFVPAAVVVGLLGIHSLEPSSIFILFFLCATLSIDPRESLMPFVVNALKIADLREHKLGRTGIACALALVLALAVALPLTIRTQYAHGANLSDGWSSDFVPRMAFKETAQLRRRMVAKGTLEDVEKLSALDRIFRIQPLKWGLVLSMLIGAGLVIIVSICRLKFTKWPIHPVLFLVWAAWAPGNFAYSFLIGWGLKAAIMRFGGARIYQNLKPVIIGLVAGELIGALLPLIVGFIYYGFTGELPKKFMVFPL